MANPSSPPSNGFMANRGSLSGAPANDKQSPRGGSSIEKLFHNLTVTKSPRNSLTPTRSRSGTNLTVATSPAETPLSPLQLFNHYLSTLIKGISVSILNERLCITFDPKVTNSNSSTVSFIQPRSQVLLLKYPVQLEIPLEALFAKASRFGQFLEEIAPHLVSLTFFKTTTSQKYDPKLCEKWLFPKLEHLDLSRCSLAMKMFESFDCPKLQELTLRRAKGITLGCIGALATRSPKFLDIDCSKCPEITTEQLKETIDCTNLLFFLRSAIKYHNRPLEDACQKKLSELFGDAISYELSNGNIVITFIVSKLSIEKMQTLFTQDTKVQVSLVIDYDKREDHLTKACLGALKAMKVETKAHVRLTQCEDLSSDKLSCLPEVSELKLPEKVALTKEYFTHISSSLPKLCRLNMSGCQIVDEASFFEFLQSMPQLVAISLQGCKWVNEKILMKLFETALRLVRVDVRGCEKVSAILQSSILRSDLLDNEVRIDWKKKMSDQSVNVIAASAARAATLVLENCETMSLAEPTAIFSKIAVQGQSLPLEGVTIRDFVVDSTLLLSSVKTAVPKLKKLKLEGPVGFSSFAQLLVFQQLTTLSIRNDETRLKEVKAALINDGSLKMIPEAHGLLTNATFEGFSEITEDGLGYIIANCKKLRSLRIKDCPKVNREALFTLCTNAGVDLQYSVSPYHIAIRQITEEDRTQTRHLLERSIEIYQTILNDSLNATTEYLEATLQDIETAEKIIPSTRLTLQEKSDNLKDLVARLAGQQYYADKDLQLLSDGTKGILELREKLQKLEDDLDSNRTGYKHGVEIRQITIRKEGIAKNELQELPAKCAVMTVTSDSCKSLRSFAKLFEKHAQLHEPTLLRLHEALIERADSEAHTEGKIELNFLLTAKELNILSTLGIIKKWVSNTLEI